MAVSINEVGGPFNYKYQAAAAANVVVKARPGFLKRIIVGSPVGSGVVEVSDHASDGDGAVKIYLSGDTIGPATYECDLEFTTGITADLTNQTHVTFVYK